MSTIKITKRKAESVEVGRTGEVGEMSNSPKNQQVSTTRSDSSSQLQTLVDKASQFVGAIVNTVVDSEDIKQLAEERLANCNSPYNKLQNKEGKCPLLKNGICSSSLSVTIDGVTTHGCSCTVSLKANAPEMKPNDPRLCPLNRWIR